MKIRVHEFPAGATWCPHCGAHKDAGQGMSCVWREVPDPERPARHGNAADDVDVIHARIKALAEERAVVVPTAEIPEALC